MKVDTKDVHSNKFILNMLERINNLEEIILTLEHILSVHLLSDSDRDRIKSKNRPSEISSKKPVPEIVRRLNKALYEISKQNTLKRSN